MMQSLQPVAGRTVWARGNSKFNHAPEPIALADSEPIAARLAAEALTCLTDSDATPYSPKRELAGLRHTLYWIRRTTRLAWYSTHTRKKTPLSRRLLPIFIGVSDFEAFPLPDRFFWLYYPLRPVFWVVRCLRGG